MGLGSASASQVQAWLSNPPRGSSTLITFDAAASPASSGGKHGLKVSSRRTLPAAAGVPDKERAYREIREQRKSIEAREQQLALNKLNLLSLEDRVRSAKSSRKGSSAETNLSAHAAQPGPAETAAPCPTWAISPRAPVT